ncbi:MAG: MFS transporter [Chloroflexota bacterium]
MARGIRLREQAQGDAARLAGTAPRRFSALRNRNFALLWFGLLISNSGSWMQLVAQGILVYDLTRSAAVLGLVSFARAVPMMVVTPMGGVVADRVPRLRLLKVTQVTALCLALILAVLTSAGVVTVWQIALLSLLAGAVNAVDQPTRQALLPDLVRREDLTNAIALNSAAWQGAAMFGPALAGLTTGWIGIAGAFYANAASFLAVVVALFLMRDVPERSAAVHEQRGLFNDLLRGLRYVRATRLVWTLLMLSAVASVFGRSYVQLLPAFAGAVLHVGPRELGLMMSAPGAGTLAGATALGALGDVQRKGQVLIVGMLLFCATLILVTMSRALPLVLVLLFLTGVTSIVFSTMLSSMLQLTVPGHMRGRVMSLLTVTFQGFGPVGALLIGIVADILGTPRAIALAAVVLAVAAACAVATIPEMRRFTSSQPAPV